jgi:hypothetical protein
MNRERVNKEIREGLAWGGGVVVVALCASFARKLGYIDVEVVQRLVFAANGLMIAWYGNRLPKTVVPSARASQARRVAGWSMVLSGLIYTGLFAFAPFSVAAVGGSIAVLTGIAVTLSYCLSLRSKAKTA